MGLTGQVTDPAVASFTDAWIETWKKNKESGQLEVASFTDAWIETKTNTISKMV